MKKLILFVLTSLSVSIGLSAQEFEGVMEFKTQIGKSIENSVWYVKGDMVRVDEFQPGTRMLKGCFLINTKDRTAKYLDHTAKTWSVYVTAPADSLSKRCTSQETKNSREFHTYKATEFIQKTASDTLHFSYWISSGKFGFFKPAATVLMHENIFFGYYLALEPKDHTLPMLVTKLNAKNEETGRLEVTRIEKRTVDEKLFGMPAGYTEKK